MKQMFIKKVSKLLESYYYLESSSRLCNSVLNEQKKKKRKDYTMYNLWARQYNESINSIKEILSSLNEDINACDEKSEIGEA